MNGNKSQLKTAIIAISFIPLVSGFGLIFAGYKRENKSWIVFGAIYSLVEIAALIAGHLPLAVIAYLISIIHAVWGCLKIREEELIERKRICIKDVPIDIGFASVEGDSKDSFLITIRNKDGIPYEFRTKGNEIISYRKGNMPEKSYIRENEES